MAEGLPGQARQYTLDAIYPSRFLVGQSPLQMQFVAGCAGFPTSDLTESFSYLDLGCGNGNALNLLAECYPQATFVGVDINPNHIALGQTEALRAELENVSYINADFAELEDLEWPGFDYITVCGVYSWIDARLQQAINAFATKQLRPGGLFGVHYSSLPGAAVSDPLTGFLKALCATRSGSSVERLERGLEDLRELAPVARYFATNPQAAELISFFAKGPASAMAHDLLNRQTHSLYFADVYEPLTTLGLEFLGSAGLVPNYPELLMTGPAFTVYRKLTADSHMPFTEATKDLMLDTKKRFDLFRKPDAPSGRDVTAGGLAELGGLYLRRVAASDDLDARRQASLNSAVDLTEAAYTAVLELAAGPGVTIAEALESRELSQFPRQQSEQAIQRLFVMNFLQLLIRPPLQTAYRHDRRYRLTSKLNALHLEEYARSTRGEDLVSPIVGSPVRMPQAARLWLLALTEGDLDRVCDAMGSQQHATGSNGKADPNTAREQLRTTIEHNLPRVAAEMLPELLSLGIVEAF